MKCTVTLSEHTSTTCKTKGQAVFRRFTAEILHIIYFKKRTFNAGDHQQNQQQHHQDCVEGVGHGRLHPCRHTQTLSQKSELTFEIIGSHSNDILYLLVV